MAKIQVEPDNGRRLDRDYFLQLTEEEMQHVRNEVGETRYNSGHFYQAHELFLNMSLAEKLDDFLTIPTYEYLLTGEAE